MQQHEVTTNEIMEFLREHMVTKEEFGNLKGEFYEFREYVVANVVTKEDAKQFATRDDLAEFRSEMMTNFDYVFKKQENFDQERLVLAQASRRHEDRLEVLEGKIGI